MNLKDIEYFHYLCKYKNFTRTAEKLYVSQPSITIALKRLEKELDAKLVIRDNSEKQISLTEAGKILEKHVNNILNEVKETKVEIGKISGSNIKLGVPPMIGAYFFPNIMEEIVKSQLANNIELIETGSLAMIDKVLSNDVDMAFIGSLAPLKDSDLEATILKVDKFVVCMSKNHRLATSEEINFEDLVEEQFIALGNEYLHNEVLKRLCYKHGVSTDKFYYTDEIQTAKSLISSGLGIGIMIEMAVKDMTSIKKVKLQNSIKFYISLAFKKKHYTTVKEEKIKNIIINCKNCLG
ncbi:MULTISPECIES: LysR family transcriptional regulator [Clostridium]|uniref:LysR family transcriptional regulator n=1 Tax=Clostridium cibarium TaxID=2762247 RepID=A0ABR8PVD6_9CLOT|nr:MULTISPECIES: LysR family transcriptional regulator [Clostridium]MBD7912137.1 LysR family transcriptional regulator [Clostridium cibarium]